jgi:hypothetical protein
MAAHMAEPAAAVTVVLHAWHAGDAMALKRLTALVYDELRRGARYYLRDERRRTSTDTVTRDWQVATLWLRRELGRRKAGR